MNAIDAREIAAHAATVIAFPTQHDRSEMVFMRSLQLRRSSRSGTPYLTQSAIGGQKENAALFASSTLQTAPNLTPRPGANQPGAPRYAI